jgi:hypothetical protein
LQLFSLWKLEVMAVAATEKRSDNGRDERGRFVVGNKGGGRPAVAREFRELCRDFMGAQGWLNLRAMANDPDSPHYFRANELIAAYALGKPTQGLEVSGADGGPVGVVVLPAVKDST